MTFPNFNVWCVDVIHPDDKGGGTWVFNTKEWHDHYFIKHRIARSLRPHSILEIGVRYGYSAHAMLSACGPGCQYVGVDADDPTYSALKGKNCDWASSMLKRTFPYANIEMIITNTQTDPPPFTFGQFDLVHIDAAHDYQGALHDMQTFWPACASAMLVDDYGGFGSESVRDAVEEFLRQTKALLFVAESITGEALILR